MYTLRADATAVVLRISLARWNAPWVCEGVTVLIWVLILLMVAAVSRGAWLRFGPQQRLSWGAIAAAVLLLPVLCYEAWWLHLESKMEKAIAPHVKNGRHQVQCERLTASLLGSRGHAGHVQFDSVGIPQPPAFLSHSVCSGVDDMRRKPHKLTMDTIADAHVLTHEAMHLRGVRNEAETECRAIQADAAVFTALGVRPERAQRAALAYYQAVYPRLRADYRSFECRENGKLDLTPGDGVWP